MKTIEVTDTNIETPPANEVLAYGRINVTSSSQPASWGPETVAEYYKRNSIYGTGEFRIFVLSESTGELFSYMLVEDGSFYWHLPPGRYTLAAFEWRWYEALTHRTLKGGINAQVEIPVHSSVCYLGTLIINFESFRSGPYNAEALDEYDESTQKFRQKFRNLHNVAPEKHVLKLEIQT